MEIAENGIYNLMDTNGRRSDLLNALQIYLKILKELEQSHPEDLWHVKYPLSVKQVLFYTRALQESPEVFASHNNFEKFKKDVGANYLKFIQKDQLWWEKQGCHFWKTIDQDIEKRARHYTSTLVKMGFVTKNRSITAVGEAFIQGKIQRDSLENILPIDDTNLVMVRQLMKLKIWSKPDTNGNRTFYSPFYMAIYLLLFGVDKSDFLVIIQGLGPYTRDDIQQIIEKNSTNPKELRAYVEGGDLEVPAIFRQSQPLERSVFQEHFTGSKQTEKNVETNFKFYQLLWDFREKKDKTTYEELILGLEEDKKALESAFGSGKSIFKIGKKGKRLTLGEFLKENDDHPLLQSSDFHLNFYKVFKLSKKMGLIAEYADTTLRILSACGLFKFRIKPQLAFPEVMEILSEKCDFRGKIFGSASNLEYQQEQIEEKCSFGQNIAMFDVLECDDFVKNDILDLVFQKIQANNADEAKNKLSSLKNTEFTNYILEKYPKNKTIELLRKFSGRKEDDYIQKTVNDSATIPTIYEYIVAIAWFYLSDQDFDLYESMNLTLNADFEPVIHAGGGGGDMVIHYPQQVVMLEVTLMNANAQKRGEWEPVLRHSLNLRAENPGKDTITFFIADELDTNTVNIWRAVAAAPLESTTTHKKVDGVVIMPLNNGTVAEFLENNLKTQEIIQETYQSFNKVPKITQSQWHDEIIENLQNKYPSTRKKT